MTQEAIKPEDIELVSEIPQLTFPRPGEPVTTMAVSYQYKGGVPRTVWVDQAKLPDVIFRRDHPEGPQPPAELVRQGDKARFETIKAQIEQQRATPPRRKLEG